MILFLFLCVTLLAHEILNHSCESVSNRFVKSAVIKSKNFLLYILLLYPRAICKLHFINDGRY